MPAGKGAAQRLLFMQISVIIYKTQIKKLTVNMTK
jgi:hypothetical protein